MSPIYGWLRQQQLTEVWIRNIGTLGLYSLSGKTSYRQISWSLEAARLGVIMIVWLWNLTGISAALLPRCLLNFRAIGKVQTWISRLRDFTRSCGKTSYRLVNRGPEHFKTSVLAVDTEERHQVRRLWFYCNHRFPSKPSNLITYIMENNWYQVTLNIC